MKKYFSLLVLTILFSSTHLLFAQFHSGDSTIIQTIRENNFGSSSLLNWDDKDPSNWLGVVWDMTVTPHRIVRLNLGQRGRGGTGDGGNDNWPDTFDIVNKIPDNVQLGFTSELTGDIDFSGLSELRILDMRNSIAVESVNVTGLNQLEFFRLSRNTRMDSLDLSNLPNLKNICIPHLSILSYLDASNCPKLEKIKVINNDIEHLNISGSDSIVHLAIKSLQNLSQLDISGKTKLKKLKAVQNNSLTEIIGLDDCPNLFALCIARSDVQIDSIDVEDFDLTKLYKLNVSENNIKYIKNISSLPTSMVTLKASLNNLNITNAAQLHNLPFTQLSPNGTGKAGNGGGQDANNQFIIEDITLTIPDSVDLSNEALVDINGADSTTTFTLFDEMGAQVGASNTTGVFNFLNESDTGKYRVEMTNSGVKVTLDTININAPSVSNSSIIAVTIDTLDFGDVVIGSSKTRTLTVENTGTAILNVSNITLPNGYSISDTSASITGNDSQNFTVTFTPTAVQTYNGTITVISDASSGSNTVNITGEGIMPVGINENIKNTSISFYPNPTNGIISVVNNSNYTHLNIYSVTGKLVKKVNVKASNLIDIREANTGIYFVLSEDGEFKEKIIKK